LTRAGKNAFVLNRGGLMLRLLICLGLMMLLCGCEKNIHEARFPAPLPAALR
jgi:hypothetical protein